ncbi:MAG: hypothetical protein AAF545_00030 [Pseudomonadota bacterium]
MTTKSDDATSAIGAFLAESPIGKTRQIKVQVVPDSKFLRPDLKDLKSRNVRWQVVLPRIRLYCETCDGDRQFDPQLRPLLTIGSLDLGQGPQKVQGHNKPIREIGTVCDQFIHFSCGDCHSQRKKYALAVEILDFSTPVDLAVALNKPGENTTGTAVIELTKYGEIPKPNTRLNNKIKRVIGENWELYRKGADDEAAGNGIGAFAYYRRVVESSKEQLIAQICRAAEMLGAKKSVIKRIKATTEERNFASAIQEIDEVFPAELRLHDENMLLLLYRPLSEGLHNRSDEECLAVAASIRVLLNALGSRLSEVIENEQALTQAIVGIRKFARNDSDDRST